VVFWFIQDAAKVYVYKLMEKYNLFGVNNTGVVVFPESTVGLVAQYEREGSAAFRKKSTA